jgi:hypothetical protein
MPTEAYNTPEAVLDRPESRIAVAHRFWTKVAEVGNVCECWIWTATKNRKGYGMVSISGKGRPAHRVSYALIVGDIPAGLQLDHLCRNRACVNPHHLEPVTNAENQRRAIPFRKPAPEYCPAGHLFTETNTYKRPGGDRECRECQRIRARERARRIRGSKTRYPARDYGVLTAAAATTTMTNSGT